MRVLLAAFLALGPLVEADAQGIVGGRVVDETSSKPLSCIEVALVNADDRMVAVTRVRRDGTFEFASPAAGSYRLAFLMSRHTPLLTSADSLFPSVDRDQTYRLHFVLDTTRAAYRDSVAAGLWFREPGQPLSISPRDRGARGLDGYVVARYAIDVDGMVIPESVEVLRSSGAPYTRAFNESIVRIKHITSRFPAREPVCVMRVETTTWGTQMQVLPNEFPGRPSGSIFVTRPPR